MAIMAIAFFRSLNSAQIFYLAMNSTQAGLNTIDSDLNHRVNGLFSLIDFGILYGTFGCLLLHVVNKGYVKDLPEIVEVPSIAFAILGLIGFSHYVAFKVHDYFTQHKKSNKESWEAKEVDLTMKVAQIVINTSLIFLKFHPLFFSINLAMEGYTLLKLSSPKN